MTSKIRREDIEQIRNMAKIEDIISNYVTLRASGMGTFKGLCPFHDEKTPSFSVKSINGYWHCFGCGKGGDVISFVQEINQMTFQEAVEFLADKVGFSITYENVKSSYKNKTALNIRKAIVEINNIANQIYQENLCKPEGVIARKFLNNKGFTKEDCKVYAIGFANNNWDEITQVLMHRGYTQEQILASGISIRSAKGKIYDRFRNRAIWPIRDITGQIIGFGARKLDDNDKSSPKYLNTPETVAYKKNQVLYGLDIAKKEIVAKKQVVVVEGYTDVMAAHLAGIKNTVATCGTAFGNEHTKIIKRLLGDGISISSSITMSSGKIYGGEVIFTFDSDKAGQNAALRAFAENQNFVAQTFIALDEQGMDPCDIRLYRGDKALQEIINNRIPLVEFVIKSAIKNLDLSTAEGRVQAKEICAPIIANIEDKTLREEYLRTVSGWIGSDLSLPKEYSRISKNNYTNSDKENYLSSKNVNNNADNFPKVLPKQKIKNSKRYLAEKSALQVIMQFPHYVDTNIFSKLTLQCFMDASFREIFNIILQLDALNLYKQLFEENNNIEIASQKWVQKILENVDEGLKNTVYELTVSSIPQDNVQYLREYVNDILAFLLKGYIIEQIQILHAKLNRINTDSEEYKATFEQILLLETEKRKL